MKNKIGTKELSKIAFTTELSAESNKDGLSDNSINALITQFENAANKDDYFEFWYARDLQILLDYSSWDKFLNVIDKAKQACINSGYPLSDHFSHVGKMVEIGSGAEKDVGDIQLTRYACYLIAQNGDSRKRPVSFAQTYFAIQTRRQELSDTENNSYQPLSEDQKRLLLRNEMKEHNKQLASAAKNAGVIEPVEYAAFTNFGYQGLYGGLDRSGIQQKKGLKQKDNILDHMGSTELAANLFRATQAEEKLRREDIKGKQNANQAHFDVGRKVRQAIKDIGGTMPEQLPTAENIVKIERKLRKSIKDETKDKE